MTGMVAKRWTRYGKDRLYVALADGTQVGWVDLQRGEERILLPEHTAQFRRTVAANAPGRQMPTPRGAGASSGAEPGQPRGAGASRGAEPDQRHDPAATPRPPAPSEACASPAPGTSAGNTGDRSTPDEPGWTDLATRLPGQAVRAKAHEELAAMRAESRLRTFVKRTFDVNTPERSWRIGADGEETVAAKLEKLKAHGWYVLHSVPVGERTADIDHVVIGPAGVFTINTKTHPGKRVTVYRNGISVGGRRTDYLRNSRHEGDRAGRFLSRAMERPIIVRPVLVILTGRFESTVTVEQRPEVVVVLTGADVPGAFRRAKPILSRHEVEALFDQARRSTTWVPSRDPSTW